MKLSLNSEEYKEVTYEKVIAELAKISDLRAMQNFIKDILAKYQNVGTSPIRLNIDRDDKSNNIAFKLEGTYYNYAILFQKLQGKIKELKNEIKEPQNILLIPYHSHQKQNIVGSINEIWTTDCEFILTKGIVNKPCIKVGSEGCRNCIFFEKDDLENKIVSCKFKP